MQKVLNLQELTWLKMNMGSNIRLDESVINELITIRDGLRQSSDITLQAPNAEAGCDFASKAMQAFSGKLDELLPSIVSSDSQLRQSWKVLMKATQLLEKSYTLHKKHAEFMESSSAQP